MVIISSVCRAQGTFMETSKRKANVQTRTVYMDTTQFWVPICTLTPTSRVFAFLLGLTHEYVEPVGQNETILHFNQLLSCTTQKPCKTFQTVNCWRWASNCWDLSSKFFLDNPQELPYLVTAGPNREWAVWVRIFQLVCTAAAAQYSLWCSMMFYDILW